MLVRGTYELFGAEARNFRLTTDRLREICVNRGYEEYIPSSLSYEGVFPKMLDNMYTFTDKSARRLCLVPEITALVRANYKEIWSKTKPKPVRLFYLARCYRYDRPQAGRFREFWQFGVEHLGGASPHDKVEVMSLADECFAKLGLKLNAKPSVKRGLDYYVEDGFEAEYEGLGAQKQVLGGGRYDCGIGWAVGVERVLLALGAIK